MRRTIASFGFGIVLLIADDGDGLILLVEWGPSGRVHSHSVHQFGSATSVPHSPHFSDQSPLFAEMQLKPVWFDEQDLAQHLSERYRPGHRQATTTTPQ